MTTFAEAILDLARVLGDVIEGAATGGSTTSLTDTNKITKRSGVLSPGTLWLLDCAQASLEGLVLTITGHDKNTVSFTTLPQTVTANDTYALLDGMKFMRSHLEAAVNLAVAALDEFTQYYTDAAFVTVANQQDYTLPTGIQNIVGVEIARSKTTPYKFREHRGWRELADGTLRFRRRIPPLDDFLIRLAYNSKHARLEAVTDEINAGVNPTRLTYEAAVWAWTKYIERVDELAADDQAPMYLNAATAEMNRQAAHRITRESRPVMTAGW